MFYRLYRPYWQSNVVSLYRRVTREWIRFAQSSTSVTQKSTCGSSHVRLCILPLPMAFFSFLSDETENPEEKLITTIKRSILCIEKEQYDKAEQMLHLALRMAQDLKSEDGVTYTYDVMANLAMEREQFEKATKLFTEVMTRLLAKGLTEYNPKVLHISAKIAHIAAQKGDVEKAKLGFEWTIKKLQDTAIQRPDDEHLQELLGLTRNWFGLLLMKMQQYDEAKLCLKYAYETFIRLHGTNKEESLTILNNLSVACVNLQQFGEAKMYIEDGLKLARSLKDYQQEAVLLSNLGLIFLREGLIDRAKSTCADAWKKASLVKDETVVYQAQHCLNEIKKYSQIPSKAH